jgi:hypothetical protein
VNEITEEALHMSLFMLMSLSNPMTWLIVTMLGITWSRFRERRSRKGKTLPEHARLGTSSSAAGLGAAFQFLSMAYRPDHSFVAKAQIQQQENTDEDDGGSPETSVKHLHRQLRRIRRGEPVERLIWRLE